MDTTRTTMKRELTLNVDGEEITLTAVRDGEHIVVQRDDKEYSVRIVAESVVGMQAASKQPTGSVQISAPAGSAAPRPAGGSGTPAAAPAASPSGGTGGGAGAVLSPMTGVVDQVLVSEGATVADGEKVVILEAMKMYIDVMATSSGSVTAVSVKAGDSVKEGQPLLTIG
jgi:glutaconyl-CoA/methylmalonyl-CoA decarboxylase subunit gamma